MGSLSPRVKHGEFTENRGIKTCTLRSISAVRRVGFVRLASVERDHFRCRMMFHRFKCSWRIMLGSGWMVDLFSPGPRLQRGAGVSIISARAQLGDGSQPCGSHVLMASIWRVPTAGVTFGHCDLIPLGLLLMGQTPWFATAIISRNILGPPQQDTL